MKKEKEMTFKELIRLEKKEIIGAAVIAFLFIAIEQIITRL